MNWVLKVNMSSGKVWKSVGLLCYARGIPLVRFTMTQLLSTGEGKK